MSSQAILVVIVLVSAAYVRSILIWRKRTRGRPLPPGPRPLPILGNMFNMPKFKAWIGHRDISVKYGNDIIYFRILGEHVVVLNSAETVVEFLDKRSANSSDRKHLPLIGLAGLDFSFLLMRYGQRWRRHRRAFWQHFNPTVIEKYQPIQRGSARVFLQRLLKDPVGLKDHIRHSLSATMMKLIYDSEDEREIEKQAAMLEVLQCAVSDILSPGRYLAQIIPYVDRLPAWILGSELRAKLVEWTAACQSLKEVSYAKAKEAMKEPAHQSIVSASLSHLATDVSPAALLEEEDIIKNVATIAFEGGADTCYSTLQFAFLAFSLYPDVVKKGQAELDSVIGPDRLPDFSDRPSLVYINAILKEATRWQNVAPLSAPHCTLSDDVLNGYFIPAGTLVAANMWACMHDPRVYVDPDVFRPERFIRDGKLDPTIPDPYMFAFGSGRRVCPGRAFADASLFIYIASILHVFDVTPPLDENGNIIRIRPEMSDGSLSYPEDCRCTIKPRSAQAEALIVRNGSEDLQD